MSGAVLNTRFLTRLLTSGEEDMLKEDISSTACELTMLILSLSVTFNVTCLTVKPLVTKSCQHATLANTFLFTLQGSALADLRYGGIFQSTLGRS